MNKAIKLLILSIATVLLSCGQDSNEKKYVIQKDSVKIKDGAISFASGKLVFETYCSGCHRPPEMQGSENIMFDGIFERLPSLSEDYFEKFICDSKKLKQSGDEYALKIAAENNSDYEHDFKKTLSKKDITDLILYIKAYY